MSVSLQPASALGFNRPLTVTVKRQLSVINHNDKPVAFKVKTTAPKLYSVRPNSGRIEPGESVDVHVMLQAMKEEPPLAAKCKDKFLIQSTFITADKETLPLTEIWNMTDDSNETTKVHQHKIKVVYLPPEGQALEEEDETHMSSMMSTNDSQYATVRQSGANGHTSIPEFEEHVDAGEPLADGFVRSHTPAEEALEEARVEPPSPRIEVTPAEPPAVQPPSPVKPAPAPLEPTPRGISEDAHNELLAKYNETQAELQRMRALLAAMPASTTAPTSSGEQTLRRRTHGLSDAASTMAGTYTGETETGYGTTGYAGSTTGTDVETAVSQSEGVPLQMVIAIAVGVFLTTYLFF